MKKEICVCDICGNNIAKYKCYICGKDLCDNLCCSGRLTLFQMRNEGQYGNKSKITSVAVEIGSRGEYYETICNSCEEKVGKLFEAIYKSEDKAHILKELFKKVEELAIVGSI